MKGIPPLVLLTGIPASGKSSFGRWLETDRDFWHVDVENATPDEVAVIAAWWRLCHGACSVEEVIKGSERPIVIDWGFPPHVYDWVQAAKSARVPVWWFDGDHDAARRKFISRATESVEDLDRQMKSLKEYWPRIEPIVREFTIITINADGSFLDKEVIFARMFG